MSGSTGAHATDDGAASAIRRIREFRNLEQGWLDGAGVAVTETAGAQGERLARAVAGPVGPPVVTPEESGGLEFEWEDNNLEASIAPDGTITGYDLDDEDDHTGERVFHNADDAAAWLSDHLLTPIQGRERR